MRYSKNGKADKSVGLIETWDVLKYHSNSVLNGASIWLIETWDVLKYSMETTLAEVTTINRNMRCIEIPTLETGAPQPTRLIETWDVLKSFPAGQLPGCPWLIETWDVLKFSCAVVRFVSFLD